MAEQELIAVIDCETTGLDAVDHRIWEVGLLLYDRAARRVHLEHVWQLPLSKIELADADPEALRIGGFETRRVEPIEQTPLWLFAEQLAELTKGLPIIGANPTFDVSRLERILWAQGIEPAWHYRPICVEALAVGFLHGQASERRDHLGVPPAPEAARCVPWRSQPVAEALGVERPAIFAHTALGDCRWALEIWRAVMER